MTNKSLYKCPICGEQKRVEVIFSIFDVPTTQNVYYKTIEDAKNCIKGDINLIYCKNCYFIYNSLFDYNSINYSKDYTNSLIYSEYYINYISSQIDYLIKNNYYNDNSIIVEVGCGKGLYLNILSQKLKNSFLYGFDTSYEGDLDISDKNIKFFSSYYPNEKVTLKPNIIINRQVIEHIPDPLSFLKSLRNTLDLNSYLYLETPDFNWIINNKTIFDIYYEHCNYWFPSSLVNALKLSGFQVDSVISAYGMKTEIYGFEGVNLCVIAKPIDIYENNSLDFNDNNVNLITFFYSLLNKYDKAINNLCNNYKNIALWGAGPKGYTFVNLLDPKKDYFSNLIDINPNKQNLYIGKTAHQVIHPTKINNLGITFIIVLNSSYLNEIKQYLFDNNLSNIDLITAEDLIN
jgi:SAM-dependent methyltransferase